jgi:protoporphyrinogen oxidase
MKIAIIGAGFGGLAAGFKLAKAGHGVTIFEKSDKPGGLATGFKEKNWNWTLDEHYHHWFTSDWHIRNLAKEIGQEIIFIRPKTSTLYQKEIHQLDSPLSLIVFSQLPFMERIRTGIVLAYLKLTPFWKPLEKVTAKEFLKKYMGAVSWKILWQPLFEKKFGKYANEIPASWFWTRINKRSPSLGYPIGGFGKFADKLSENIRKSGGEILFDTGVESLRGDNGKIKVNTKKRGYIFDKVICTLPSPLFLKITEGLPKNYKKKLLDLKGIGAVNLVLSLDKQFLTDGSYWLNINEKNYPFLAVVEHTNFIDKKYYGNENLIYVGNYVETSHKYFRKSASELVDEFLPFLRKINPKFSKSQIKKSYVFKTPFGQPIVPLNYSKQIPDMQTPINNLYLANIQQVYPWDRGTTYAVELGEKVAELVVKSQ